MPPWKTRDLEESQRHDTGADVPEHIVQLAWLLEVPVEYILKNPRSYTPRTNGTGDADSGHIDPCKLME